MRVVRVYSHLPSMLCKTTSHELIMVRFSWHAWRKPNRRDGGARSVETRLRETGSGQSVEIRMMAPHWPVSLSSIVVSTLLACGCGAPEPAGRGSGGCGRLSFMHRPCKSDRVGHSGRGDEGRAVGSEPHSGCLPVTRVARPSHDQQGTTTVQRVHPAACLHCASPTSSALQTTACKHVSASLPFKFPRRAPCHRPSDVKASQA